MTMDVDPFTEDSKLAPTQPVEQSQSQLSQSAEQPVSYPSHWPPPTAARSLAGQTRASFQRLILSFQPSQETSADSAADPPAPSPARRKTRATTTSTEKGKGKATAQPSPSSAAPSLAGQTVLETSQLTRAPTRDFQLAASRDFLRIEQNRAQDRQSTDTRLDNITSALVALTETTAEIHATRMQASPQNTSDVAELRELFNRVARSVEDNDELAGREFNGVHQRIDSLCDDIRRLEQTVASLSEATTVLVRHLQLGQSGQYSLAELCRLVLSSLPPSALGAAPAVAAPFPVGVAMPALAAPLPAGAAMPTPPAPAAPPPMGQLYPPLQNDSAHSTPEASRYRAADSRNNRPPKRARALAPPSIPQPSLGRAMPQPLAGTSVIPIQHSAMQSAPPPMPLPGQLTDHPAVVRFGRVRWAVQSDSLRQQVYACGRVAWDAFPGLFPSITDFTLQPDDHEYAEMTFPSNSLARTFVDAWQRHRGSAGEWRRLQAHLV